MARTAGAVPSNDTEEAVGNAELARIILGRVGTTGPENNLMRATKAYVSRLAQGSGVSLDKYRYLHAALKKAGLPLRRFFFEAKDDETLADIFEFAEANREKILVLMKKANGYQVGAESPLAKLITRTDQTP